MGFFNNKIATETPKRTAPPSMPVNPVVKAPEPEPFDPDRIVAPWAVADCGACKGTGINSRGSAACRICDGKNKNVKKGKGLPTSDDYGAHYDDDLGRMVWNDVVAPPVKEDDHDTVDEDDDEQENPDEIVTPTPTRGKLTAQDVEDIEKVAALMAGKPAPKAKKEKAEETAEAKRGRRKKGITLLINCSPVKGASGNVILLEDIIRDFGNALAEAQGEENFFCLDSFKRRDMLAQKAGDIAEMIGTNTLVARPHCADSRALLTALRPYATTIVEGATA